MKFINQDGALVETKDHSNQEIVQKVAKVTHITALTIITATAFWGITQDLLYRHATGFYFYCLSILENLGFGPYFTNLYLPL